MAAGHGGQVLLSRATKQLAGEQFDLRELGEHRLRDLPAPERLYQLGSGEHPPLKTARSDEPAGPGDVVPRIAAVSWRRLWSCCPGRLGSSRSRVPAAPGRRVSLCAPPTPRGGVRPDGTWWVPLASVSEPELVLPQVAQVLGRRRGARARARRNDRRCACRDFDACTAYLDNAEHLLPRRRCGDRGARDAGVPTILVTSRSGSSSAASTCIPCRRWPATRRRSSSPRGHGPSIRGSLRAR